MTQTYLSRFWSRVRIGDGCWEWTGPPGSHGYGQAMREDKTVTTAPRMAYEITYGDPEGFVCHTCNNRLCVRPSHLYDGTHQMNMDDIARGRYHSNRKLSSDEARTIYSSDKPQRVLAKEFGIDQAAVWRIKQGLTYRYDTGASE